MLCRGTKRAFGTWPVGGGTTEPFRKWVASLGTTGQHFHQAVFRTHNGKTNTSPLSAVRLLSLLVIFLGKQGGIEASGCSRQKAAFWCLVVDLQAFFTAVGSTGLSDKTRAFISVDVSLNCSGTGRQGCFGGGR